MKTGVILFIFTLLVSSCGKSQVGSVSDQNSGRSDTKTMRISPDLKPHVNGESNFANAWDYCGDLSTRLEYQLCLSKELKKSETRLTDLYGKALTKLKEGFTAKDVQNLSDVQQKWQKYAKAHCLAEKDTYGEGTDAVGAELQCLLRLTEDRVIEIDRVYRDR